MVCQTARCAGLRAPRPVPIWSASQRCNSWAAPSMRAQRWVSRWRSRVTAASASAGAAVRACSRSSFFWALSAREASHSLTQAGASPGLNRAPCSARSNNSARPCLQGNLRLGQLQRKAGPARSTWVW